MQDKPRKQKPKLSTTMIWGIIVAMVIIGIVAFNEELYWLSTVSYVGVLGSLLVLFRRMENERAITIVVSALAIITLLPLLFAGRRSSFLEAILVLAAMVLGIPVLFYSTACIIIDRIERVVKPHLYIPIFAVCTYALLHVYSWLHFNVL